MKAIRCIVLALSILCAHTLNDATGAALWSATDSLAPYTPALRSDMFAYRFVADADDASAIFVNPAGLGARRNYSSLLSGTYWYDRLAELSGAVSFPELGIGYTRIDNGLLESNTFLLGLGHRFGRTLSVGTSLRWHHTDLSSDNRSPFSVDLGFLLRPHRFASIGGVWKNTNRPLFRDGRLEDTFTGGISLRPFTERITISGQGTFSDGLEPGWMFGVRFSILPGFELFGSYMKDLSLGFDDEYEEFTGGIQITFGSGTIGTSTRSRVNGCYDYSRNSFFFEKTDAYVEHSIFQKKKYAEITISGTYLDEGGWFTLSGGSSNLHGVLRELEAVRSDEDIRGLLLVVGQIKGAFIGPISANLHEIREAVARVKAEGKPVVAYLTAGGSGAEFYLASVCDRIIAPCEAVIGTFGVSLELNRMKRLFAKLGVDWDYSTAGDYKSTFHTQYTDTSTAVQIEELRSLVREAHRLQIEAIADGRGISMERMKELADGRIFESDESVAIGLIDAVGWENDAREELGKIAGIQNPGNLATTSIAGRTYWAERWTPAPAVAVVGAYGAMGLGKSERDFISGGRKMGAATVVKQLKAASSHPGVRAIVFRVDSGGGWALAGDEILNEIRRIQREVEIPVVVSMGNVAGSGGYWISMYADAIFADPFTITGSIGVVYAKPVLERLYEKIGVTNEVFKSGEHTDAASFRRFMTAEEKDMLSKKIEGIYERFISSVSEGRKMSPEQVREIAGGRVYLGTQALDINLVDTLGGLKAAVEHAAAEAGIADDYRTVYFKAFPGLLPFTAGRSWISAAGLLKALWKSGDGDFDETITVF